MIFPALGDGNIHINGVVTVIVTKDLIFPALGDGNCRLDLLTAPDAKKDLIFPALGDGNFFHGQVSKMI